MANGNAKTKAQNLLAKPFVSPREFHEADIVPISLNRIYMACNDYLNDPKPGVGIECLKLGRKVVIVTAPWRRRAGIEA